MVVTGTTALVTLPVPKLWKSWLYELPVRDTTPAFAALAAIIAQVPAAKSVIVFKFFMMCVLSIV
jgi:hypothetical protein